MWSRSAAYWWSALRNCYQRCWFKDWVQRAVLLEMTYMRRTFFNLKSDYGFRAYILRTLTYCTYKKKLITKINKSYKLFRLRGVLWYPFFDDKHIFTNDQFNISQPPCVRAEYVTKFVCGYRDGYNLFFSSKRVK